MHPRKYTGSFSMLSIIELSHLSIGPATGSVLKCLDMYSLVLEDSTAGALIPG
jgi:hypothetical protein